MMHGAWQTTAEVLAITPQSQELNKDLRARGFRFVGPTVMYAHMQACGMVNDHTTDCFHYSEIAKMTKNTTL